MIIQTNKPLAKRHDHDFYATPREFCDRALAMLDPLLGMEWLAVFKDPKPSLRILDPGCGAGVWGQAAKARWTGAIVDGVEIRDVPTPDGYRWIYRGNFLLMDHGLEYDLVIGNPPYFYAEPFVRVGLANTRQDGLLLYLLPLRFLEGKRRAKGLFRDFPPREVWVAGRVPFLGTKKTDATAYAMFLWQKGWTGTPSLKWMK